MNILYRKKILRIIKNCDELEKLFLDFTIFKFFKRIPNEYVSLVSDKISNTNSINFKKIKKWYREVVNYPESIYDEKFLLSMGWDHLEVVDFIKNKQKENSKILSDKKLNNPELFYDKSPKRIEYWLKKGLSENESLKKISESQKTFSRDICIQKYGVDKGMMIFNSRQKKWIESLKNNNDLNEINTKKNSYLYNEKKIKELISRTSFLNETKKNILGCIEKNNIKDFVECIISKVDVKSLSDIIPYINSNLVSQNYNIDRKNIKEIFLKYISDKLHCGYYGQPVYHNGIRFKSLKEYKLCLLFEERGVNFIYEKRYPNSNFKSDFYLINLDLYVEYFGILDGKNIENLDEKQLNYYDKMIKKVLYCDENKIKLTYDTNFNKLYERLKTII